MAIASGSAYYDYRGPRLHFTTQNQNVAPSAILWEEAMFVLKAEYNRVRMESSGFEPSPREFGQTYDPMFPNYNSKFVNNNGTFIKYITVGTSGLFDPEPSGRHLDGTYASLGETSDFIPPGMFYSVDPIKDMREVLVQIFQAISLRIFDTSFFVSASSVARDWFTIYKGYNDGCARSGLFYEESGVVDFVDDDYLLDWRAGVKHAHVGATGMFDRHLDEVRYQPMPYLGGTSGSIQGLLAPSSAQETTYPISPVYWRTDGTLAGGWQVKVHGNALVPNTAIVLSGINGTFYPQGSFTAYDNTFMSGYPASGTFAPVAMTSGFYKVLLSGVVKDPMFPWIDDMTRTPDIAQWPRGAEWVGAENGSSRAIYVTNTIQAMQDHDPSVTSGPRPLGESGLYIWVKSPPNVGDARIADFWQILPHGSGVVEGVWGHDLRSKMGNGIGTKTRAGGWIYHRPDNKIRRVHSSGGHQEWTNLNFQPGYTGGSGFISVWSPTLPPTLESVNLVGTFSDGVNPLRAYGLETITYDGTDYICAGTLGSGDMTKGLLGPWYLRIDTSYNLTDAIPNSGDGFNCRRVHYNPNQSEFLGVSNADLNKMPGVGSGGYYIMNFTWVGGSGSNTDYAETGYYLVIPPITSGILNITDGAWDRTPRIIDFFNDEQTNDLFCIFWAYGSGNPSGTSDTWKRWIGELDDSSHPMTLTNTWVMSNDSNRDDLNSNVRNSEASFFIDNWEY